MHYELIVNFGAVSSVSISRWSQGRGGHLSHQRILVTHYQYRSFHLGLNLVLERELLLLQVVLKIKNITRVIHGDFDIFTPKELRTQILKYGGFPNTHDVSQKSECIPGHFQFLQGVEVQQLCLN